MGIAGASVAEVVNAMAAATRVAGMAMLIGVDTLAGGGSNDCSSSNDGGVVESLGQYRE